MQFAIKCKLQLNCQVFSYLNAPKKYKCSPSLWACKFLQQWLHICGIKHLMEYHIHLLQFRSIDQLPVFGPMSTNVTVQREGTAFLHCPVKNPGDRPVSYPLVSHLFCSMYGPDADSSLCPFLGTAVPGPNQIALSLNISLSSYIYVLCCLVSSCPRSLGSVSVTGTSSLMAWFDSQMTTDSTSYTKKALSTGFYRSTK